MVATFFNELQLVMTTYPVYIIPLLRNIPKTTSSSTILPLCFLQWQIEPLHHVGSEDVHEFSSSIFKRHLPLYASEYYGILHTEMK